MLGSAQRELYEGVAAQGRLRATAIEGCDTIHSSPGGPEMDDCRCHQQLLAQTEEPLTWLNSITSDSVSQ